MKTIDINKIISDAKSNNVDIARAAIFKISSLGIVDAKPLLKELLYITNQWVRDAAAISLGDLKANEVVPEIMDLINNPNNKENNGSLIYALRKLEVKDFFLDFIKLLTSHLESRDLALDIIEANLYKVSTDIQKQALIDSKKDRENISKKIRVADMEDKEDIKNTIQYIDYAIYLLEGKKGYIKKPSIFDFLIEKQDFKFYKFNLNKKIKRIRTFKIKNYCKSKK